MLRALSLAFIFLMFLLFSSCGEQGEVFVQLPVSQTKIQFKNELIPTESLNILTYLYYYNGAGVATGDYNNDGLIDLYFVGNQVADQLYINQGNFSFEEVSKNAGITIEAGWSTSVTNVDINQDGWLDLYICKVGSHGPIVGKNLLYVNQGANSEGQPVFAEAAASYGLDLVGYATQASFFDYDLDGDLDLFLVNHSVHPNRSYGKGKKRNAPDALSGDRLFRNDEGQFLDVTAESGIFQGNIGYGLDVSVGDMNEDGYPDLYVSNDFFENDYLYINQGNGTFKEMISANEQLMGHTSHFSMGNVMADLDNDGRNDLVTLDMLPENLATYKSAGNDESYPTYQYYLKNGYAPQYMQNALHRNRGNGTFSEMANLSGIAATEWSWSVLAADFDRDGKKDLYITNGIKGATNDMDFVNFIANDKIQKDLSKGPTSQSLQFAKRLPEIKVSNYAYQGVGDAQYQDMSEIWFDKTPSFSNGSAYADLDNDGDLDLVVNNVDEEAFIYENRTGQGRHYMKIRFNGPKGNLNGIGARVMIYGPDFFVSEENFITDPYLSSTAPEILLGLDSLRVVDSVVVVWPGGRFETQRQLATDQLLTFSYESANGNYYQRKNEHSSDSTLVRPSVEFVHTEETALEFSRDPLIPFSKGNEGPTISVKDVNGDGLDDFFIGGAKWQSSELFYQTRDGRFESMQQELFAQSTKSEDTGHLFFDCDGDNDLDLVVVSGGNEFRTGPAITPRLYRNMEGMFVLDTTQFQELAFNAAVVASIDLDADGDLDLLIGTNAKPFEFGSAVGNFVLRNDGAGHFEDVSSAYPGFQSCGLIEAIEIADLDGNDHPDVVVAGYWMPVMVFYNDGKSLTSDVNQLPIVKGWWNTVKVQDFDQDGDLDIVAGNWGLNSRLKASDAEPVRLYRNDFDQNGKTDPVITYHYQGIETTLANKDELTKQMPFLNKKYLSYKEFAKADLNALFGRGNIAKAEIKEVTELASSYFENQGNGTFTRHTLPLGAQISSVHAIAVHDFDGDSYQDLFLVGNTFEVSTQLGRLDASHGTLLLNDQNGFFKEVPHNFEVSGPARDIQEINVSGEDYLIVAINNGRPVFLRK